MMITILILVLLAAGTFIYFAELMAALAASWFFFTHLGLLTYILHHPWLVLMYLSAYFLIGAVWSVVKWWFKETNEVRLAKTQFADNLKYHPKETWADYLKTRKTKPEHHKQDFMLWIAFWPFSALFTLLDDPVRRLCRRLYQELQGVYQRITDHVWR